MAESGYDINDLVREAQIRWLKPAEILFILRNHENHQLSNEAPQKPPSGSLFLFNKRVLRFFGKDGHSWLKKKDGRTVGEAHERLKVGNAEALNCYYAHGNQNPNFQRRSYWMLDPAYDHIVLVHYRDITEGRHNTAISNTSATANEDQCSLEDTLAAVRNAAQAAARIQSAFRAHSFRKRQRKEAVIASGGDEYGILSNDIHGLAAASKLAFRNTRDHNSAALAIQKKYRGWKGRKDFLSFR